MPCPINTNNNKFKAIFCDIKKSLMRTWKEPFLYLLLGSVLLTQNIKGSIPVLLIWVFAILVFYMVKHYFFVKPSAPEATTETKDALSEEVSAAQKSSEDDSKPTGV